MCASIDKKFNVGSSSFGTHGYYVVQCSDDMWYMDTLNDIWDLHISRAKFPLIAKFYSGCEAMSQNDHTGHVCHVLVEKTVIRILSHSIVNNIQFHQNILSL